MRILHLSDIHLRVADNARAWRRRRVLGDSWRATLESVAASSRIDWICLTGDIAFSGRSEEYDLAADFLDGLLQATGVKRDHCLVVPGNHDIDRSVETEAWSRVRTTLLSSEEPNRSLWVHSGKQISGLQADDYVRVRARGAAFRAWSKAMGLNAGALGGSGDLGFRVDAGPLVFVGLDTAWLCGDDADRGSTLFTEDQIFDNFANRRDERLHVLLMHHPLHDLADGASAQRALVGNRIVLLRGHLHEQDGVGLQTGGGGRLELAAGCLYDSDRMNHGANSFNVLDVVDGDRVEVSAFAFSNKSVEGHWFRDESLFYGASRTFAIRSNAASTFAPVSPQIEARPQVDARVVSVTPPVAPSTSEDDEGNPEYVDPTHISLILVRGYAAAIPDWAHIRMLLNEAEAKVRGKNVFGGPATMVQAIDLPASAPAATVWHELLTQAALHGGTALRAVLSIEVPQLRGMAPEAVKARRSLLQRLSHLP